jgi:RNA binding exosome subunit
MSTSETGAHEESAEERLGHVGARIDDLIVRLGHASEKFRSSVGDHLDAARVRRQQLRADLDRLHEELEALHARIDQLKAAAEQASTQLV